MFFISAYRNNISLCLILLVNGLFFSKYAVLHTARPLLFTALYLISFIGLIFITRILNRDTFPFSRKINVVSAVVLSAVTLIYIISFPRMGEIGRLPAIEVWIQNFLNGIFPYNTHLTPSSFPVIFFLAFPFYLLGNTGLLSFMGLALFLFLVLKGEETQKGIAIKILITLLSIVTVYEIVTRSELLFNIVLVVLVVFISERKLNTSKFNLNFFLTALLTGLVLSTRSVTALLFLIYFL